MPRSVLRNWLMGFSGCLALAQGIYFFEPAEYGSFVQRFLTPYLFPGLVLNILVSGNVHSDPIPVIIVLGTGVVWSIPVLGAMLLLRRHAKDAA